jgi:hypothetical protein
VRGPIEPADPRLQQFYDGLVTVLRQPVVRDGQWRLLECAQAWDGNSTWEGFLCFAWQGPADRRVLVAVNYAPHQGQSYVRLPFEDLRGHSVRLGDRMSSAVYDRSGDDLLTRGLYLDLPGWGYHVFEVSRPS